MDQYCHCVDYLCCLRVQKEQMMEAQEMFRTSNKVTRPEKALILGFMAGSRGKFMCMSSQLETAGVASFSLVCAAYLCLLASL